MKASEMFNVQGYGAVVTGGASGLGLAFTEVLAENGARVTMLDISAERLESEGKRLRAKDWDVSGAVVDVTKRKDLIAAIDAAAKTYGRLDVVFANAGIDSGPGFVTLDRTKRVPEGAIENYEDARWDRVIETNLNSVFTTIKAAAKHMKAQKSGRIIVTTSVAGLLIESGIGSAYMAAKAGAAHFMRAMALEMAKYNVTVNAIAPGPFITNIGGGHAHRPEVQKAFGGTVPVGRMANTEEIKGLALLLASPASSFITGAEIPIDGGCLLGVVHD
jgi:NAD(P)-dependent dehydrogenase (short-subunit alcohol dehydrogenase family)